MKLNQTVFAPLFLVAVTVLLALWGMRGTKGLFNYAMDDAYIHLTIARNLALTGVWGYRPDQFCSASSSLLWTVLLASCYKIGLKSVFMPLILNIAAAVGIVVLMAKVFGKLSPNTSPIVLSAKFAMLLVLPHLVLLGMEHTLQCFLYLCFWAHFSGWVQSERRFTALLLLSVLVATIRYEGLFLVGAAVLFCFYEKKWLEGLLLAVCASLPVVVFGLFSMKNGGYFLPNSLMAKTGLAEIGGRYATFLQNILRKWWDVTAIFWTILLVTGGILAFWKTEKAMSQKVATGAWLVFFSTFLQVTFAKSGQLFRFESGQLSIFLAEIGMLFCLFDQEKTPSAWMPRPVFFGLLMLAPILIRGQYAFRGTVAGMQDISSCHFAMAEFLEKYYPHDTVAVQDIGVVGYETQVPIVDVIGLATTDVLKQGVFGKDTAKLNRFFSEKKVKIALLYPDYIWCDRPTNWDMAGSWHFSRTIIINPELVFYAFNPADAAILKERLLEYSMAHPGFNYAQPLR